MHGGKISILVLSFLFSLNALICQQISGTVTDENGEALYGVNIYVKNTNLGVTTNSTGNYNIKLTAGNYSIVFSFIGFESYELNIELRNGVSIEKDISLRQSAVTLPEIEVVGDIYNDAERIIIEVLKNKNEYLSKLSNYSYRAYNRMVFSFVNNDTARIGGITETISNGYFKYPDLFREELIARKQTANFTEYNNVFAAGKIINVLNNSIDLFGTAVISPLASNALSYYSFSMADTTFYEGKKVFMINFEPKSNILPLFRGRVGIIENIYTVVSAELNGEDRINCMFAKNIVIKENLREFENYYWLPVRVEINFDLYLGIPGIPPAPVNNVTQISEYVINSNDFNYPFDKYTLITKIAGQEEAASLWNSTQIIPLSYKEESAYRFIDSIISNGSFFQKGILALTQSAPYLSRLPITSIDDFYHFNRTEGSYIGAGFESKDLLGDTKISIAGGYGVADKKYKWNSGITQSLFNNRFQISASYFSKLDFIDSFNEYSVFDITYQSLFYKNDYGDYFYNRGASIDFKFVPDADFSVSAFLKSEKHSAAFNNSDYSFFKKNNSYRKSIFIDEKKLNSAGIGLSYSTRRFINMGFAESPDYSSDFISIDYNYEVSPKNILESDFDYYRHSLKLSGNFKLPPFINIYFAAQSGYTNNSSILENQFFMPGSYGTFGGANSFKTINEGKFIGSEFAYIFLENNFKDTFFKMLGIPLLEDSMFDLFLFMNTGLMDNRAFKDEQINTIQLNKKPLVEAGFGIGNILMFLRLDFAWRVNNSPWSDFSVSVSSTVSF